MLWRRENAISELDRILGEPRGAVLYLSMAMILPFLAARLNVFVDTAWVTDLGQSAITAVSLVKPIYIMISCVGVGFGIGASTCISYYIGKNEKNRAESIASNALVCGLYMSVAISVILIVFVGQIIIILGAENVSEQAKQYLLPMSITASAMVTYGIMTNLLKAEGAAKKVSISVLLNVAVNMVLDPIMIFGLGLGVSGAAWSTSIANFASVALIYYWYRAGKMHLKLNIHWHLEKEFMKEIFSIGVPRAAEEFCSGLFLLAQRWLIILVAGTVGVMMHSLAFSYLDLLMVIPEAVGASIITVGSVCVGQRNRVKLNRGVHFAMMFSILISLIATAILFFFPDTVLSFFFTGDVEEYKDQIVWAARIYSLVLPLYVLTKLSSYILQVIRKSKLSAYGNLALGLIKTAFNAVPLLLGILSFEAAVWCVTAGYVAAAVLMITLAHVQYRKFDINSVGNNNASSA